MIRLPIRRCPECGYIGLVSRFESANAASERDGTRELECPRCGQPIAPIDPRLK